MSQTRKLRIGILSTARIGANHVIPAIHQSKNAVVVAVASRDLKRAQEFAKANNIAKAYGSYEELFTDAEVDAVYNPLPNHLHLPLALQCLAAGKAQLCEKPLTLDAKEAQQMVDAYAKANVLLAEAFMYRFHPQTDKVVELVRSGAIGTVKTASASFGFNIQDEDDIRMKREWGGGALWDVGTYTTNLVRMIFNASPIDVCAYANFGAKSQCDENVVAIMKFADGGLAHFDCSFRSQLTQTYDIKGTKGRIFVERAFVPFMPDPKAPITLRVWRGDAYETIDVPIENSYKLMVEDFADAYLNKRPPRFPMSDSVEQMKTLDMLMASARKNDANNSK